jgi:hypothetical protein
MHKTDIFAGFGGNNPLEKIHQTQDGRKYIDDYHQYENLEQLL